MRGAVIAFKAAIAVLAATCGPSLAQTGAPPPGATACLGCHAGSDTAMPSLKGRSAQEIEAAMIAFRAGNREATVMDRIAKGFDEAETKALSAWLADAGGAR